MTTKNFGAGVSGFLDPDLRAFETAVYQAGKPILDKENNLVQDLDTGFALALARQITASGWLTNDFINQSDPITPLFSTVAVDNTIQIAPQVAQVNGWVIPVGDTNVTTDNQIDLGVSPAGNGVKRTDIVILEVWRKLISASPSTDGKSAGGRIWRNGNVKIAPASDAALNLADDILDAVVGSETTKRVQIQYRLRAVSNVDIFAYPYGLDDPSVVANSSPPAAATPDGVATLFAYTNQSAVGDPGLWRAGDGNPANTLSTVDGYMYALPLLGVFRRNTNAFDRNLNHNGGVSEPGPSDRPDGLFYDRIVARDIADLRQGISMVGHDYQEILERNVGRLLDNVLRTEWITTTIGGGSAGHSVFWADEVGTLPGDGTTTGDTPGAEFIGQFDYTRRFFSDRPVYEVLTYMIAPGDPSVSTATWQAGTVVTINPTALAQYPFTAINFPSRAPTETRLIDIVGARISGSAAAEVGIDVGSVQANAPANVTTPYPIASFSGLGTYPPGNIVLTMGTPPAIGLTTEPIYVDILVAYPPGSGLAKTPTNDFGLTGFVINNVGSLPAGAPVSYAAMENQNLDRTHREVQLQYRTSTITYTFIADSTVANVLKYKLPERVYIHVQTRLNGVAQVASTMEFDGCTINLNFLVNPGDVIAVDYQALRPMPQSGVQMTIYYEARAPQTAREALIGTTQHLVPRAISPYLYTLTTGSGSQGEAYPYPTAYVQTGGVRKASGSFAGEHELNGTPDIYVEGFNANVGMLRLPTYIPYTPNPEEVDFDRIGGDADIEGRTFFKTVPSSQYIPAAYATPLTDSRTHKVFLPALMETTSDTPLGRKGTLVLVLITRWAEFDRNNNVAFDPPGDNDTVASVFRISGNLLNRRS